MTSVPEPPIGVVRDAVARALDEDLAPLGDLTSALVPDDVHTTAALVARAAGVLAGSACATETFRQLDESITIRWHAADGDAVTAGMVLAEVAGPLASVLTAERTALNFVGHLSGVATETRRFVDAVAAVGSGTRIWDTRKTTPGLRSLEKAAVRAGGGVNHRGNLSEWVMFKDNHLTVLGIDAAVRSARSQWPGRSIQVECDDLGQVDTALAAGADAILLDNMTPDEVAQAVERRAAAGVTCLLEASGGVTLGTVASYAATGVDLISVGSITNSAPVLDVGLDIGSRR